MSRASGTRAEDVVRGLRYDASTSTHLYLHLSSRQRQERVLGWLFFSSNVYPLLVSSLVRSVVGDRWSAGRRYCLFLLHAQRVAFGVWNWGWDVLFGGIRGEWLGTDCPRGLYGQEFSLDDLRSGLWRASYRLLGDGCAMNGETLPCAHCTANSLLVAPSMDAVGLVVSSIVLV